MDLRLTANPCSPLSLAKGDSFRKAPSSVDPIIWNLGQVLQEFIQEVILNFLTFHDFIIDSSSLDVEYQSSVWTRLRVTSIRVSLDFFGHNIVMSIHQPFTHPPPSPTREHAAADNLQTVIPGIHG